MEQRLVAVLVLQLQDSVLELGVPFEVELLQEQGPELEQDVVLQFEAELLLESDAVLQRGVEPQLALGAELFAQQSQVVEQLLGAEQLVLVPLKQGSEPLLLAAQALLPDA